MPTDSSASDEARTLLLQHVETFDKLEVLVYLWRARGQARTARSIADALQMSTELVVELVAGLCASGLTSTSSGQPPVYAYAPASPALARAVDALATLQQENRLWITNLMLDDAKARLQRTFSAMADERTRARRKRGDGDP